jgi:hypothetical protein
VIGDDGQLERHLRTRAVVSEAPIVPLLLATSAGPMDEHEWWAHWLI